MVLFDKFDPSIYEVPPIEIDVSPVSTSEIRQEYPQLGSLRTWTLGEQTARKDGTIVDRTYRTLDFDLNAEDFDLVDAGYEEEIYGGRYYWRVIYNFTETERYSAADESFNNFKVWEVSTNTFQLEVIYNNKPTILDPKDEDDPDDDILANLTWTRPTVEAPLETTPPPVGAPQGTLTTYACPIDEPDAPIGETGESAAWLVPDPIDQNTDPNDIKCLRWASLPKPFYLVFDAGKSLGATFDSSDLPYDNVYISTTTDLTGSYKTPIGSGLTDEDPFRMEYRYLIFEFLDPGRDDLTTLSVTFLANELYRSPLPLTSDTDPELREHFDTTDYIAHAVLGEPTRYKPPGEYTFPDNFWNDTDNKELDSYGARVPVLPSIIGGS